MTLTMFASADNSSHQDCEQVGPIVGPYREKDWGKRNMRTSLRRLSALLFTILLPTATASAGDSLTASEPVYDITHFDCFR